MRLIDADEYQKKLASIATLAKSDQQKALIGRAMYCLDNMPTAYDVEKVVEQINAEGKKMSEAKAIRPYAKQSPADHRYYKAISVKKAVEIVRNGGKE